MIQHRSRSTLVALTAMVLASASLAQAATYYVKPSGNDANSGTSESSAWEHVQKACVAMVAGDTVLIRSGVYAENSTLNCAGAQMGGTNNAGLTPHNSGAPGAPIVFKGYPGDTRPIILGVDNMPTETRVGACLNNREFITYDSLEFRHCYVPIFGEYAVYDITIRNCKIDSSCTSRNSSNNCGGVFIDVACSSQVERLVVENCEIFDIWSSRGYGVDANSAGILLYAGGECRFSNNVIHDTPQGINLKGTTQGACGGTPIFYNIEIDSNVIYNTVTRSLGIGAGGGTRDCDIHHNIMYGNAALAMIEHAHAATTFGPQYNRYNNNKFYNNTIDCEGNSGGWFNFMALFTVSDGDTTFSTQSIQVFNNIFYRPKGYVNDLKDAAIAQFGFGMAGSGMGKMTNFYEDHNMIYESVPGRTQYSWRELGSTNLYTLSQWQNAMNLGGQTTMDDPLFIDATNHDYRLQAGSPAESGGRGGAYPTYRGALGQSSPDTLAPSISAETATGVSGCAATTSWYTNEPATSRVEYGTTTGYGLLTPLDGSYVTNHAVPITDLSNSTLYHYRVISQDPSGNQSIGQDRTFTTLADGCNLALSILPNVSDTYAEFTVAAATDGVVDAQGYTLTNWASDDNPANPHWIEVDFGVARQVENVTIHWGFNSFQGNYMTSAQYIIQSWNGVAYSDVTTVNNIVSNSAETTTNIPATSTQRIRIYQPAGAGPPSYTGILWLTELQIFDAQSSDSIPPAPVTDMK